MLSQAVWSYCCSMCSRECPSRHSCLVNYVVTKERRSSSRQPREAREAFCRFWRKWDKRGGNTDCSWVWHWVKHAKNNRKAATQGECPSHKPRVLVFLPIICHLIQEMNDRFFSQEDRFLGLPRLVTSVLPTKLQGLSNDVQDKICDMQERSDRQKRVRQRNVAVANLFIYLFIHLFIYLNKTKWLHSTGERPTTLADTLDCINPTLFRNVYTIRTILLTMTVSTATPERSFSTTRRVKTYLRATMKTERLSALALMHPYKEKEWQRGHASWVLGQE